MTIPVASVANGTIKNVALSSPELFKYSVQIKYVCQKQSLTLSFHGPFQRYFLQNTPTCFRSISATKRKSVLRAHVCMLHDIHTVKNFHIL